MYSETFWDHVRHPRNNRPLQDALVGEARFHRCGDKLTLYIKVDDQDRITEASFQAKACAPVIAVASIGTEKIRSIKTCEASRFPIFDIDKALGGLPHSKRHAYLLFLECLDNALSNLNFKEKL